MWRRRRRIESIGGLDWTAWDSWRTCDGRGRHGASAGLRSSGLSGVPINDEDEDDDDVIILLHFSAAFSLGQCELWLSVIDPKLAKLYHRHIWRGWWTFILIGNSSQQRRMSLFKGSGHSVTPEMCTRYINRIPKDAELIVLMAVVLRDVSWQRRCLTNWYHNRCKSMLYHVVRVTLYLYGCSQQSLAISSWHMSYLWIVSVEFNVRINNTRPLLRYLNITQ